MGAGQTARDQKKAAACQGVVAFEDEASFWLDGTLHQTWSRKGVQPRVDTYGLRKTGHVFGAITVEEVPQFTYQFSDVFNGHTFHQFLELLVEQHKGRKVFLIIDNGPCHWLDDAGKAWLGQHGDEIELHRLPPYSPEFNPMEGVWKTTKRVTTHNRFFLTTTERDDALRATFSTFRTDPGRIAGQVARYLADDRASA